MFFGGLLCGDVYLHLICGLVDWCFVIVLWCCLCDFDVRSWLIGCDFCVLFSCDSRFGFTVLIVVGWVGWVFTLLRLL